MSDDSMKHGHFSWNELATKDTKAAGDFYTKLLGWTTAEMDMGSGGKYTILKDGEAMVGGMMQMTEEWGDLPPHWMSYITVENVDESCKHVEKLGGKVCVPPTDIPEVGRFSVITDPTGGTVSLITYLKKE